MLLQEGKGYEIIPENIRTEELPALCPIKREENKAAGKKIKMARTAQVSKEGSADTKFHTRNFLDCVKARTETHCPIETGHRSTSATLLARIALMRKKLLQWDAKGERFTNDEEANKLLGYQYREPWKFG